MNNKNIFYLKFDSSIILVFQNSVPLFNNILLIQFFILLFLLPYLVAMLRTHPFGVKAAKQQKQQQRLRFPASFRRMLQLRSKCTEATPERRVLLCCGALLLKASLLRSLRFFLFS
jgi:hypothetical protein